MGSFCSSKKKMKLQKFTRYKATQEDILKVPETFPHQYLKVLEQRYYALQPKAGLNFDQLTQLLQNIAPKLLKRLFMYFKMETEDQIDFTRICLIFSKFINQGKMQQVEIIFDLYDLDENHILDQEEFQLLVQENQNLFVRIDTKKRFTKSEFIIWAEDNMILSEKTFFLKIFQRPEEEKKIIEECKDQIELDRIYIISSKWWDNWKQYVNIEIQNPGQQNDNVNQDQQQEVVEISPQQWSVRPGPIDNADIAGEYEGELKVKLIKGRDYVTVGKEAWNNFMKWYGITDKKLEFKRKCEKIEDQLKIELYPTVIQGFETNEEGIVLYKNCFQIKMYENSTMHDVRKKLFQKFKIITQNGSEYLLYMMKINEDWKLILNLDSNIMDLNITSGTFFTMTKLKKKPSSQVSNWKLGQKSLIKDSSMDTEKMCLVQRFSQNHTQVILHIEGQTFLDDFQLEIKQNQNSLLNSSIQGISRNIRYPGLQNLGNTCYMNAALQCLINTQYFSNFLINERYKRFNNADNSLIKELSVLAKQLNTTKELSISPSVFQDALVKVFPKFRKHQAQDADEFLFDLLSQISKELNEHESVQISITDSLFQGEYLTKKKCLSCQNEKEESDKKKTFHMPIQEQIGVFRLRLLCFMNLQFTNDRKQIFLKEKDLMKKTIIIKSDTPVKMNDLYKKINSYIGLSKEQYELAIIYKKNIYKTIICINENQKLTELGIDNNKTLILYQLGNKDEAKREFENISKMIKYQSQDFQKNDLVDFQEIGHSWKQGKIEEVYPSFYKLLHCSQQYDKKLEIVTIRDKNNIQQFRQKIPALELNFMKVPVLNYYFNTFQMQYHLILKPIILLLPIQQLSLLELKVYIYKQIQRFIDFNRFNVQSPFESSNISQQEILQFFRHSSFPYKIRVLDQDRKCLYCQKIRPEKNNNKNYHCQGCEVEPILLNFQQTTKARIILEWDDIKFSKILEKRKDEEEEKDLQKLNLLDCFKKFTEVSYLDLVCNKCGSKIFSQNSYISKQPIILIITFQKLFEKYIDFPLNSLDISDYVNIRDCVKENENENEQQKEKILYDLYAVINNKRQKNDSHYTAYLKKKDNWYEFDDSNVTKVEKVQTANAYMLFYSIQNIPQYSDLQMNDFK